MGIYGTVGNGAVRGREATGCSGPVEALRMEFTVLEIRHPWGTRAATALRRATFCPSVGANEKNGPVKVHTQKQGGVQWSQLEEDPKTGW